MSGNIPRLKREADRCTGFLKGRRVVSVRRYSDKGVLLEFEDGMRFYIDALPGGILDLSIEGSRLLNMGDHLNYK